MILIRNALFYLCYYPGSTVLTLIAAALLPFGRPRIRWITDIWSRYTMWCAHHILGIRIQIEGTVPGSGVILAAKHESMFEAIALLSLCKTPTAVFKEELLKVPVWGRIALAYGVIPIFREDGTGAMRKMLREARGLTADGRSLLIFPEGTRVQPGSTPPIHGGVIGLYVTLRLPLVCVAVDSGRVWPRTGWLRQPGVVTFRFAPAIPPGGARAESEAAIFAGINALCPPPTTPH